MTETGIQDDSRTLALHTSSRDAQLSCAKQEHAASPTLPNVDWHPKTSGQPPKGLPRIELLNTVCINQTRHQERNSLSNRHPTFRADRL